MFKILNISIWAAIGRALEHKLADKSTYAKFENAVDYWSGHIPDWKPHTVTTEDGYIITVF